MCFQGVVPAGDGFKLNEEELSALGYKPGALPAVIHRYILGKDLVQRLEERYIIDFFGLGDTDARDRYPQLYQRLLDRIYPERKENKRAAYRDRWWVFAEARPAMRRALIGLRRYIATPYTAKFRPFIFVGADTLPDAMAYAIASDDAFALGVLSSRIHLRWAGKAGGKLEDRPRYNSKATFFPFPFPAATDAQTEKIRALGESLDAHRKRQQAAHPGLTITGMYNVLEKLRCGGALSPKEKKIHDDGLVSVLKKIHDDLDAAVFEAYGWPVTLSDEEILERLVALNHERADEEKRGLVRWLRPEFQSRAGGPAQLELAEAEENDEEGADGSDGDEAAEAPAEKPARKGRGAKGAAKRAKGAARASAPMADPIKHAWPAAIPEQIRLVRGLLGAVAREVTAKDLTAFLDGAKPARLKEILDTLVALGHARKMQTGYRGI